MQALKFPNLFKSKIFNQTLQLLVATGHTNEVKRVSMNIFHYNLSTTFEAVNIKSPT